MPERRFAAGLELDWPVFTYKFAKCCNASSDLNNFLFPASVSGAAKVHLTLLGWIMIMPSSRWVNIFCDIPDKVEYARSHLHRKIGEALIEFSDHITITR